MPRTKPTPRDFSTCQFGDVIARFAIGVCAVDDNEGVVIVASGPHGFSVFVTAGMLPDGSEVQHFKPTADAMRQAFALALKVAGELAQSEVVDTFEPDFDPDENCTGSYP